MEGVDIRIEDNGNSVGFEAANGSWDGPLVLSIQVVDGVSNDDRVVVQGSWSSTLQELNGDSSGDSIRSPGDIQNITNLDNLTVGWYRDGVEASGLGKDGGDGGQNGGGDELVTHYVIGFGGND